MRSNEKGLLPMPVFSLLIDPTADARVIRIGPRHPPQCVRKLGERMSAGEAHHTRVLPVPFNAPDIPPTRSHRQMMTAPIVALVVSTEESDGVGRGTRHDTLRSIETEDTEGVLARVH
jgi:hypothetical protein